MQSYMYVHEYVQYLGYPGPELCVLLRVLQEIDKLHYLNLGLLAPGHVPVERGREERERGDGEREMERGRGRGRREGEGEGEREREREG